MILVSHVDLRVRNRARATEFYDAFLNLLGAVKREAGDWTRWTIPPAGAADDWRADSWFAITEDAAMTPGTARIAFLAPTRGTVDAIATYLPAIGAQHLEPPHAAYAGGYACFFEDPDGNKLEIVALDDRT
jgi:catechol 2,3-dioxygenase-like lactoylglutathione lyase family enzyme